MDNLSIAELLTMHSNVLNDFQKRGVLRSKNNLTGDYGEWLVSNALGLTLAGNSEKGYDAIDGLGFRYSAMGAGLNQIMKIRTIRTNQEIDELVDAVTRSAEFALAGIVRRAAGQDGLQALWSMKFSPVGCDPLDANLPLNLIEQVNQTFTYLASAKAVRVLLHQYPDLSPYIVNLGTSPGSDIQSACGSVAAEVFAAVNTSNNQKLAKDRTKVSQTNAAHKYVFFMCPGYALGRQEKLEREFGVEVWSVGDDLACSRRAARSADAKG